MLFNIKKYPKNISINEKKIAEKPYINKSAFILNSRIGSYAEIGENSRIIESIVGDYSYDAGYADIIYAEIGKFASIASYVRINPGNHPMSRVSQHHFTYRCRQYGFKKNNDETFFLWRKSKKCIIGHDAWIGHASTVMPGVKIGNGAVIGANSVVTKDIEDYVIAAGSPARPIKKRFDEDTIQKLLNIKWWDWDKHILEEAFDDFIDINAFIKKYH